MTTLTEITASGSVSFGTSGARGLVADFTPGLCAAFTQAFLHVIGPEPQGLLIAHDLRPSSPVMAGACAAAALEHGCAVIYAGALPTPALAYASLCLGLPAIMVTGSHIPHDRNGIKFYRATGEISKADEQQMLAADVTFRDELPMPPLPPVDSHAHELYVRRYLDVFASDALRGMKIGVYEHSSVSRDLMHEVLRGLGAETIALGRTDEFVAVDTEAISTEDERQARAWSNSLRLDAIVATDGDGDRPMLADEHGVWMRGDTLGLLCAQALGVDVIVTPVSSNTAAELSNVAGKVIRTRIGSPHVIAAMDDAAGPPGNKVVGYEANGGFLLGSDIEIGGRTLRRLPTRDAVLPLIATMAGARRRGMTLAALSQSLPRRFTHSDRLQGVPSQASRDFIGRLQADPAALASTMAPRSGAVENVDLTDGLRAAFANGDIVHLRPSGNAPELRCYAEAGAPETAATLCAECLGRVRTALGV